MMLPSFHLLFIVFCLHLPFQNRFYLVLEFYQISYFLNCWYVSSIFFFRYRNL